MVAILPRGSATFFQGGVWRCRPAPRPSPRKAQFDKPHGLVTPSTTASRLRRSRRAAHTWPAWRPTGPISALGEARTGEPS